MDSILYYFSGTGNSYKIAKDIADKLGNAKLMKINQNNLGLAMGKNYKAIGIVFPVYYFTLPKIVETFIENLNVDKDTYIFSIATCGGMKGFSLKQLQEILNKKGMKLSAGFSLVMPDNYQVLYSPPTLEKQQKLLKAADENLDSIIEKIKQFNIVDIDKGKFDKVFIKSFQAVFKPKYKDNNFWTDENCNNCGICSKVCPVDNIAMEDNKPKWLNNCEHCLGCMQWCPKKSIQYKKSTVKRDRYTHPGVNIKDMMR